jgi:hypothetical protein
MHSGWRDPASSPKWQPATTPGSAEPGDRQEEPLSDSHSIVVGSRFTGPKRRDMIF